VDAPIAHDAPLEAPVWFAPLRSPSWLLPAASKGTIPVTFAAERWPDDAGVSEAGEDLRLGLPLYLAEAIGFLVAVTPSARLDPVDGGVDARDGLVALCSVAPEGRRVVRIRVADAASGAERATVELEAADEEGLGAALADLPRALAATLHDLGAISLWDARYTLPPAALAGRLVRGQRTCLRLADPALHEPVSEPDRRARRREQVREVLRPLATAATSTEGSYPAMLFFGSLLSAHDAGADLIQDFRLPANARCMSATEPHDPVFRMSVLVLRAIGDGGVADQRARSLGAVPDPAFVEWLARVTPA
jgi:hypothetical protein